MKRKEYKKFIKYEIGNGFKGFIRSHFDVSFNSVYLIRKSQYIYSKGKMGKIISKYYTKKLVKNIISWKPETTGFLDFSFT